MPPPPPIFVMVMPWGESGIKNTSYSTTKININKRKHVLYEYNDYASALYIEDTVEATRAAPPKSK